MGAFIQVPFLVWEGAKLGVGSPCSCSRTEKAEKPRLFLNILRAKAAVLQGLLQQRLLVLRWDAGAPP